MKKILCWIFGHEMVWKADKEGKFHLHERVECIRCGKKRWARLGYGTDGGMK